MKQLLLVGNPNCGKTTLFNALTGQHQRVGNWAGVTVEKKTGLAKAGSSAYEITDLPGLYSLSCALHGASPDEQLAAREAASMPADCIINVVDACHLERHLYLTSQLLELNRPMVVVLTMMDIAALRGITVDVKALASELHCPVVTVDAQHQKGFEAFYEVLNASTHLPIPLELPLPDLNQAALDALVLSLTPQMGSRARYGALRMAEGDTIMIRSAAVCQLPADMDLLLADARYQVIHRVVQAVQSKNSDASEHFTARLDRWILHRYLALPIFLLVMYTMFLFAINVGGAFQDFFDKATNTVFVQGTAALLQWLHAPGWVVALLANGLGKGINTTLTFIPVIAAMFFFLALLETSGYMARAAFVVDKIMRVLGLPGKSFVPMIVGFGCNVPGIMAARTLDSERDRILTVLMSPFMSCSARLAIYAVFVAAFFPTGGQNIVFALYLIGISMAVMTGFLLRKTLLTGQASPLVLELPAYHKPSWTRLWRETSLRLRYFIVRAGRLILPVCVILGGLNAVTWGQGGNAADGSMHSVLSWFGQLVTPLFAPMGLHTDNWPATVGLLTGMLAKEVVIGTLNSLYAQVAALGAPLSTDFNLWHGLSDALWTIPQNLASLGEAFINPVLASAPHDTLFSAVYGIMVDRFDGKAGAFAYLLFILLYIPCVSTMAAIRQETSTRWMVFSVVWSLLAAYGCAVIFYQSARLPLHPGQSLGWIIAIVLVLSGVVYGLRWQGLPRSMPYAVGDS